MNLNKKLRLIKEATTAAKEFEQQGKIQESVDEYLRAAKLLRSLKGNEAEKKYARALNNAALGLVNLAQYPKVKQLLEKALPILKRQLGGDHIEVAAVLNNLANVYSELGDYEQAKELHQRALAIREKQLGDQHLDVAGSLNNLANVYNKLGDYEQAKELHQRALAIREKRLRDQHPDVARSLNNLANVYKDLGDYEQANELYQRARSIVAKTLGEQHPLAKTISDNYFKLQDEVAELQRELIEAEKFKFLGQIATQVAHNINNPLQIIHGNVTGALDDLQEGLFDAEKELRPLLENLKQQTDRIGNLIRDFRKLAHGDRKKLVTVDLNQLVDQSVENLRGEFIIHRIQLVTEYTQPAPQAHSNALVVTEAIVNLLSNAKDALISQNDAKVILSTWEDAQQVGIKVEDNGKGIHPEQQSQLFHTLYPSQKTIGWGMGLYISHHTLKSLGGKITYSPREPVGACFTITLKKANHVQI